jgi:RNA polymerase sigma factor (sigma-70 family)
MAAVPSQGRAIQIESLAASDGADACTVLYERHAERLLRYCLFQLGGRREDAEDAVQITYLHALKALRRGVKPRAEAAWLRTIARNVCIARRDGARRRGAVEAACDPHVLGEFAAAPDADHESATRFRSAVAALPERQRRAILLREWQGLSYREIAEDLGLSLAAVETLIFRARRALAAELAEPSARITRRPALGGFDLAALFGAVKSALSGAAAVKVVAAGAIVGAVTFAGAHAGLASEPEGPVASSRRVAATPPPREASPSLPSAVVAGVVEAHAGEPAHPRHPRAAGASAGLPLAPGAGARDPRPASSPPASGAEGRPPVLAATPATSPPEAAPSQAKPRRTATVHPQRARTALQGVSAVVTDEVPELVPAVVPIVEETLAESTALVEEVVGVASQLTEPTLDGTALPPAVEDGLQEATTLPASEVDDVVAGVGVPLP